VYLSIELTDVTLEQALKIILEEEKLQARFMEEKRSSFSRTMRRNARKLSAETGPPQRTRLNPECDLDSL
jgi:hypothetical protein